jgi:hypothetical protein
MKAELPESVVKRFLPRGYYDLKRGNWETRGVTYFGVIPFLVVNKRQFVISPTGDDFYFVPELQARRLLPEHLRRREVFGTDDANAMRWYLEDYYSKNTIMRSLDEPSASSARRL